MTAPLASVEAIEAACPGWAKRDNWVVAGLRGSHSHGTYVPPEEEHGTDDVDVFVVTFQDPGHYMGLRSNQRTHFETAGSDLDILVYDIRKFVTLLEKGNPNVHSWLWGNAEHLLFETPASKYLRYRRDTMISRKLFSAFAGYARGQLALMTRASKRGYMGKKREALMTRYGYDIKNAAHCLRLALMAWHLATKGVLLVELPEQDRRLVLRVKRGEMGLDEFMRVARDQLDLSRQAEALTQIRKSVEPGVFDSLLSNALGTLHGDGREFPSEYKAASEPHTEK